MGIRRRFSTQRAFALPTVLIASIVLLTVLSVSVTATAAIRTTLKNQYYVQLAQVAGESGVAFAKACLAANANIPTWTDASPLTPATDCTGTINTDASCPGDARCYVTMNGNVRSSFSVTKPTVDGNGRAVTIPNTGYTEIVRTSSGSVWRTYKQPSVQAAVVPDLCSGNASSTRGWNAAVKAAQQDSIAATGAQSISVASGNVNAGVMYFRKDFSVSKNGSYDLNLYTGTTADAAVAYLDGAQVASTAGSLAKISVSLTGGCHVLVVKLTNKSYVPRPSDFTASLGSPSSSTPLVVSDTTWRVTTGDSVHFSTPNFDEAGVWEPVYVAGLWSNTSLPWGGAPTDWGASSKDTSTNWISTTYSSGSPVYRPASSYAWFRSQNFTTTATKSVLVSTVCDDNCVIYLDGTAILNADYSQGTVNTTINIPAGTHVFGVRLYNAGSSANNSAFLFSSYDNTGGAVLVRGDATWDGTTSWLSAVSDSYSYDKTFTPNPSI